MIDKTKRIAIYHNLPRGGGVRMLDNIIEKCKDKYIIDVYVLGETRPKDIIGVTTNFTKVRPWRGFLFRNLWIYFVLPQLHRELATQINQNYRMIFLSHDYYTKSPYLLRYLKIKNIYLCQEPQREFYEPSKYHAPNIKNKIANIFRYPIKLIDESNVKYAAKIICNSKYSKGVIKKVYHRKCDIVYPGVDEKYFSPNKKEKKKIILCVGGINPVKDQLFLIRALKPILKKYKLILVGSGKKEYLDSISHEGGKEVHVISNIKDWKLRAYYRKALVTCISAHMEPFGLSSIESQACGTPVVAINEGGLTETVIDGVTGFLTNRNKKNFMEKVCLVIKNHNSMGYFARRNVIKNWTWDKTLAGIYKILE